MADVKVWKCGQGHVMGQMVQNGSHVWHLLLYRQALDQTAAAADAQDVDVFCVVEGYVADVKCSVCGCIRTWMPGKEAMEKLIRQVERMRNG